MLNTIKGQINTIYDMDSPDDAIRAVTEVESLLTSIEELLDNEPCTDIFADNVVNELKGQVKNTQEYLKELDIEGVFKEMAQDNAEYKSHEAYKQSIFNRR